MPECRPADARRRPFRRTCGDRRIAPAPTLPYPDKRAGPVLGPQRTATGLEGTLHGPRGRTGIPPGRETVRNLAYRRCRRAGALRLFPRGGLRSLHGSFARTRPFRPVRRRRRIGAAGRRRGQPRARHAAPCAADAGADSPDGGAVLFPQHPAQVRMRDRADGSGGPARARPGRAVRQRPAVPDFPPGGARHERRFLLAAAPRGRGVVCGQADTGYPPRLGPSVSRAADRGSCPHPEPRRPRDRSPRREPDDGEPDPAGRAGLRAQPRPGHPA